MGINATNAQSYYLESLKNRQSQNGYTLPNGYVDTPVFYNNVQQTAVDSFNNKTTTPADGKDDGSIGFFGALKNIGKGVVKFFTNMFTDENGDFSLKQTAKTLGMIGLITAATFIPVVGPLVLPALCAYGMVEGGLHVIKGVSNAMSATTDADAEQAWQDVGSGATEGVLSYVGYKQTGGFKAAFKKSGAQLDALMAEKPTVKTEQLAGESETVKSESSEVIEETNVKAEAEAKAKAEAEAKAKAEAEAKAKAEAEAKAKAEAEAKAKAEAEAKAKAEAEAKAKAEAEAKAKAEAEAKAKAEAEAKAKAEAEAKAKAEAEAKAKAEAKELSFSEKVENQAREFIDNLDEKQLSEIREFLKDIESTEYNNEIIRHATTPEYAEAIRNNGYDVMHRTRNNGSNNFGGMDVEVERIGDFGNRYGDTKLEYSFSGKALKLTNKQSEALDQFVIHDCVDKTGKSIYLKLLDRALKDDNFSMADVSKSMMRGILQKLGYDAIEVAPLGKSLFLTILNPNKTQGLQYIRTYSV